MTSGLRKTYGPARKACGPSLLSLGTRPFRTIRGYLSKRSLGGECKFCFSGVIQAVAQQFLHIEFGLILLDLVVARLGRRMFRHEELAAILIGDR
jgi:hypothetical protein